MTASPATRSKDFRERRKAKLAVLEERNRAMEMTLYCIQMLIGQRNDDNGLTIRTLLEKTLDANRAALK